jgi:Xaa-Pro aminopeptidase
MSHAPSRALSARHDHVRHTLASRGLDALVVTSLPNILYLTNFSGSSAIVILTADHLFFLTDFRYLTVLGEAQGGALACPTLELVTVDGSYDATLAGVIAAQGWRRIGFEAAHLTVDRHRWLTATIEASGPAGAELIATERIVERARVRKDAFEIATLREAARRLSAVATALPQEVRRGLTERDGA